MIRRLFLAAFFLVGAWSVMVYAAAANENSHPAGGGVSPLNLGALVVLAVGLVCAGVAYAFFSARGAFALQTSSVGRMADVPLGGTIASESVAA